MRVISDLPLRLRWQNKSRDIHYIIRHLTETLGTDNLAESHLQVANELFYRNKAAWLVLCAFLFYGLCTAARSAGRVATGNSAR